MRAGEWRLEGIFQKLNQLDGSGKKTAPVQPVQSSGRNVYVLRRDQAGRYQKSQWKQARERTFHRHQDPGLAVPLA